MINSKSNGWQTTSWRTVLELNQTGAIRDAALDRFLAKYRRPLRAYAAILCARKFSYAANLVPDDVVDSFIGYGIQQSLFEKVRPPEDEALEQSDAPRTQGFDAPATIAVSEQTSAEIAQKPRANGRFRDWLKTCFFQFVCAEARLDTRLQRARVRQDQKGAPTSEPDSSDDGTRSPAQPKQAQYRNFVAADELQIAELRSADVEFEKARARDIWESAERLFHLTYSSEWQYRSLADSQRGVTILERMKKYAKTKSQIETASLQMITAFRTLMIGEIQKDYGRPPNEQELKEELDYLFRAARDGKWALTFPSS